MKLTNLMLVQIQKWIDVDPHCVKTERRILELSAQRRMVVDKLRQLEIKHFRQTVKELRKIDLRYLSKRIKSRIDPVDGVAIVTEALIEKLSKDHVRGQNSNFRAANLKFKALNQQITMHATALGRRRSFLRLKFEAKFVSISQKEMLRNVRSGAIIPEVPSTPINP